MSAVVPISAGALQHTPSRQLPPQPPTQSALHGHPSPIPALASSDSSLLYTNNHHAAMIQTQAQAQQMFRQRQLLAYQQQQQFRLQQQQQQQQLLLQQKQSQLKQPPTQSPSPSQVSPPHPAASEQQKDLVEVKDEQQPQSTSNELTPIQTHDTLQTSTTTPTLTPGTQPFLKNTKRPSGLNKRHSTGLAVLRLLQFAEQLDPGDQALQRAFWDGFIADFFTKSSKTKLGLRNSETDEQRPFYISHYSVAKFFHTLYECGVSSIQLTLEQTMEFILPGGQMNVECPRANFIYRYSNGSLVSSTGHLWVRFSLTPDRIWKIKHFEFACQRNEEFISRSHLVLNKGGSKLKKSNKHALPESPINAWGIPPKAFHILQMMDAAVQLDDILFYSLIAGATAKESLTSLAFNMEQQQQSKDTIMTSATALDTPDPPASPGESDSLASPQVPTSKKKLNSKKPSVTRRKSLKNSKVIKQEEEVDQSEPAQQGNIGGNSSSSPIVKTQNGYPLQQQQQQQQAFFQQQRKMLLEQQAYQQQQHFQSQQPLPSGLTPSYLPSSNPLSQTMSPQAYIDSFGSQQQLQQQESPQKHFRKRSDSMSENNNNKKPSASRKKGKTGISK
ncbi:unnamed protein product [Absidia cylindrospora]